MSQVVTSRKQTQTEFSIQDIYFLKCYWHQDLWEWEVESGNGYRKMLSCTAGSDTASISPRGSSGAKMSLENCPNSKLKWPGLNTPTSMIWAALGRVWMRWLCNSWKADSWRLSPSNTTTAGATGPSLKGDSHLRFHHRKIFSLLPSIHFTLQNCTLNSFWEVTSFTAQAFFLLLLFF